MENKIYVVKYSSGSWDNYSETILFVTNNKSMANKFIKKYNSLIAKWKQYYIDNYCYDRYADILKEYEANKDYKPNWDVKEEFNHLWDRWNFLEEFNKSFLEEVEQR